MPKVFSVQHRLLLLRGGLAHLRRPISDALVPQRDLIGRLGQQLITAVSCRLVQPVVQLVEGVPEAHGRLSLNVVELVKILVKLIGHGKDNRVNNKNKKNYFV